MGSSCTSGGMSLRWQPWGSQAGQPLPPLFAPMRPMNFELCASQSLRLGAASVQPGPLLWGGGVGTRPAGALPAPDSRHTSAVRGLQVGQRRAPSFLRLIKPCLLEGEGGALP